MADVQQKLEQLRKKFVEADDQDQNTISQWEKELKRAMLLKNLKGHAAVKMLLEGLMANIDEINSVLLNLEVLTELDRKILLMKRDTWKWFVNLFTNTEAKIDSIEQALDANLEN